MLAYPCVDNVRVCASMPVCGQHASAQRMCVCVCVCVCAQRPSAQLSAQSMCLRGGVGFQRLAYQQGGHKLVECECLPVVAGQLCTA